MTETIDPQRETHAQKPWTGASSILCVRLDNAGDVLMTSPAIRALKESIPKSRITLLSSPAGANAAKLVPEIDAVRVFEAPWMKSNTQPADMRAAIRLLERERFDAAVIFTVYSQNPMASALLCYSAGIPLRLAYTRHNLYRLLTHAVADPEPDTFVRHEVQRQLDLVAAIGCFTASRNLSFAVSQENRARVRTLLSSRGIAAHEEIIVLHPGASAPSRRYDLNGFAQAARMLCSGSRRKLVVTGSRDEKEMSDFIVSCAGPSSISVAGELTLEDLAALIERASLLISNNSGPAHIAAAAGTPSVIAYALTNPQHRPWGNTHRLLFRDVDCRFCYKSVCPSGRHTCLAGISPETITAAAEELLSMPRIARIGSSSGTGSNPR